MMVVVYIFLIKRDFIVYFTGVQAPLKSRLFEGRIPNGPVFKWSGFSYGLIIVFYRFEPDGRLKHQIKIFFGRST